MCPEHPVTGSTTTFKHFECVIKLVIPFTTLVPNGGNHDFPYSVDFPFYLQNHIWEHQGLSHYFI